MLVCFVALLGGFYVLTMHMPGRSYRGALPALTDDQEAIRDNLRRHVGYLAETVGERHMDRPDALGLAADYVESEFAGAGASMDRQWFKVGGVAVCNVEATLAGRASEVVIVGAHYDSVLASPGANDNASGVAVVLELARLLAGRNHERTIRLIGFVNEEPPHFQTEDMGSMHYARRCRERDDNVVAMISFDGVGFFSDEPGSQRYLFPLSVFYPSEGNFIAFVGNIGSRGLVRRAIGTFRSHAQFPSEGAALPGALPGVGWSDHWSFWQFGYPGIEVTDTLPYRYAHYHTSFDTADRLDFDRMAHMVDGMVRVIEDLAGD